MKSPATMFLGLTRFRLASLTFSVLLLSLAAAGMSSSQDLPNRPPSSFDMSKWKAHVTDGVQYYECRPPACSPSTLVSYRFEPLQGDLRKAFDAEVARWIGAPGDKKLLEGKQLRVFGTLMTGELLSVHASWHQTTADRQYYGAIRMGFKAGHKTQVVATSDDLEAARSSELQMSRALGLVQ